MTALTTLREYAGMTISETAKAALVSASYLARVEAGKADPSPAWIGVVAGAMADRIRSDALARIAAASVSEAMSS